MAYDEVAELKAEIALLKTALGNRDSEVEKLQASLVREKALRQIQLAAKDAGVSKHALNDVLEFYAFRDGKQWALDKDGQAYQLDGDRPAIDDSGDRVTPMVFVRDLKGKAEAEHLFAQAPGSASKTGPNPWIRGPNWNMTEQGRIFKSDPARAKQLAAAAGQKLDI